MMYDALHFTTFLFLLQSHLPYNVSHARTVVQSGGHDLSFRNDLPLPQRLIGTQGFGSDFEVYTFQDQKPARGPR